MSQFLNLKYPASFTIQQIFSLNQGLNWGPSDPEADDIPVYQRASLYGFLFFRPSVSACVVQHYLSNNY